MSGTARPAVTAPSRQCTSPWTIDCGWTSTSSWSCIESEEVMRLDQFEAFVHEGRGVDVDLRPHRPDRVGRRPRPASRAAIRSRVQVRNGPPEAVSVIETTSSARPGAERLVQRVVLGIDRQDGGPKRLRIAHEGCAGADEALLVGERDARGRV